MTIRELLPIIDLECEITLDCDAWWNNQNYENKYQVPNKYLNCEIASVKGYFDTIKIEIKE